MTIQSQTLQITETTKQILAHFPWEDRKAYAEWLSQTYHFVRHSTRLLALAAGVATLEQQLYHEQFTHHIREELGHEKLALSDLKNLGEPLAPERPGTRRFYETPKNMILRFGPAGLIGYMHFLETLAVECGPYLVQLLVNTYESNCVRFLQLHSVEDVGHVGKINHFLLQLPNRDLEVIQEGLNKASHEYIAILNSTARNHRLQLTG